MFHLHDRARRSPAAIAALAIAFVTLSGGASGVAQTAASASRSQAATGRAFAPPLMGAAVPGVARPGAAIPQRPQEVDEEYTAKILEDTTDERFLTPLVEFLPASDTVPTPLDFNGYIAGGRDHLTYAEDVHAYIRAVAAASPRVEVVSMGMTEENRERLLVIISEEETIADLDRYKEMTARLADPRTLRESEAEELIQEAKPIYWALGGLHSGETGPPEMMMELVYRLAVEERPFFQEIRENSIVMLTPVVEVDGRERIVDIIRYWQQYPDRTEPPLLYWGKYVAHDNNRDGIGLLLSLSTQTIDVFDEYHLQVMHDLHESVPFLYIMTGHGPYNPWLDPIVTEEWTEMAWHEVRQMNTWNVPGVWTFDFFDGWATNYMMYAALGRNAIGRFYETFGNRTPDTRERTVGGQARRDWFRMNPPEEKVMWSLRNNTNLMESALLVGMNNVATNKERFLRSYYVKSKRTIEKAHTEGPAAWVMPADAARPVLTARLINLFRKHKVEVHRLDDPVTVEAGFSPDDATEEMEFAAGSYLIRMDQPYSRLPDMLLDFQYYNPDDPRPYDDTGWTMGATFNVETYRVTDTSVLDVDMTLVSSDVSAEGGISALGDTVIGAGSTLLVKATGEPELATLRYRLADVPMTAAEGSFEVDGESFPAGTLLVSGASRSRLESVADELGIVVKATATVPDVATHDVGTPRVALVHNWFNTQSEGWYRAMLDELEIPFDYISIHDVRDIGDLGARWDAIIMAPGFGNFLGILHGREGEGEHPIPWQQTELTPNIGVIDSTPDIRRGLGYDGLAHLTEFVESGGLLLTMADSSGFAIQSGLTRHVAGDSVPGDLQAQGVLMNAKITDMASPITYGFDEDTAVYFRGAGPLMRVAVGGGGGGFRGFGGGGAAGRPSGRRGEDAIPGRPPVVEEEEDDVLDESYTNIDNLLREDDPRARNRTPSADVFPRIVMRFAAGADDLLLSGMMRNGSGLADRPAIIDAPVGEGHVVMYTINPMWRHQTWGQAALVLNAILHHDALDAGRGAMLELTEEQENR